MTISIKPTASGSTIEQDGSTILTVDGSGNITPSNQMYPKAPAFSARLSSDQNFSISTWTKIQFDSEDFDTNSNYDNSTNYRFTPTVAGYYLVTFNVRVNYSGSAGNSVYLGIYKNGSVWTTTSHLNVTGNWGSRHITSLVHCNGSSDYIEAYANTNHASPFFDENINQPSRFSAHLVSV